MSVDDRSIADLYAAPLEEFTARRNAIAREVAAAGEKLDAAELRALPKPNAAAWALNQLARQDPEGIDRLLDTSESLRRAQHEDGGDLRALHAQTRAQVATLVTRAQSIVEANGRKATQALKKQVAQSLMAAAADERAGEQLRAGRLTRELEPGGFEPSGDDLFVPRAPQAPSSPRRQEAEARVTTLAQEAEAASAHAKGLAEEADRAQRVARRARARAEDAAAAAESKRARADAARRALRPEEG